MIKSRNKIIYSLIYFNEIDQFCVVVFESVILGSMNMFLSSKKGFLAPSLVTWQKEQMAPALSGIKDSWGLWSTIGLLAQVNLLRYQDFQVKTDPNRGFSPQPVISQI